MPSDPGRVTPRELEVVRKAAWGYSNKEIAAALGITVKTVEVHKTKGLQHLGIVGRQELIRYALKHGWFVEE